MTDLRESAGARNEIAIGISRQERQIADVIVGQVDAEDVRVA